MNVQLIVIAVMRRVMALASSNYILISIFNEIKQKKSFWRSDDFERSV